MNAHRSARSSARGSLPPKSSMRSRPSSTPTSPTVRTRPRPSLTPIAASARHPSRRRSMALLEAFARPLPLDPADAALAHADLLAERFDGWGAGEVLDEVIHRDFPGHVALVSSFGAHSVALLHLVASVDPRTPVIFIDTGKIFGSTHRYREEIVGRLGLSYVRIARPDPAVLSVQDTDSGLWLREPDRCCAIRKVAPLARALSGFDAW